MPAGKWPQSAYVCVHKPQRTTRDTVDWKIAVLAGTLRTKVTVSGKCLIGRLAVQMTMGTTAHRIQLNYT